MTGRSREAALAKTFQVSRQVIVQDIALIRAEGNNVISTNRGYILNAPHTVSRIFKVHHTDADLENELCGIVDLGGKVINVMVNHRVYGHIEAELNIAPGARWRILWRTFETVSPVL